MVDILKDVAMDMRFYVKERGDGLLVPCRQDDEAAKEVFIEICRDGTAWINGVVTGWEK